MIGILLISTGKYKQFVKELVKQIDKYFLPNKDKKIFIFTDYFHIDLETNSDLLQTIIPEYKFPYATLYRYKIFSENNNIFKGCSHLFYLDVDSAIINEIGKEFLVDEGLVVVRHPGFYKNDGWGDNNNPTNSRSYLPQEMRKHYYCGGVQGGVTMDYLYATKVMAKGIEEDEKIRIMAEWNDETFWNHYIHTSGVKITEFNPEYCMPEQLHLQQAWGLTNLTPKIIALSKNHEEIRS